MGHSEWYTGELTARWSSGATRSLAALGALGAREERVDGGRKGSETNGEKVECKRCTRVARDVKECSSPSRLALVLTPCLLSLLFFSKAQDRIPQTKRQNH